MEQGYTAREWLDWLTRVRLLMIALILSGGVAWRSSLPLTGSSRCFLPLLIFWITLGTLHIILVRWLPKAQWHGPAQVISDVVMVSALVYTTGLQESYFTSLYLLVIIVASILFSRNVAFVTAAVCAVLLGGLTLLAYACKIPRTYVGGPTTEGLRLRREIEFRPQEGQQRYVGISVSPRRSRDAQRQGYVFNFQDLTDFRRLEQEVATKDRMAALGRLSAAIAHEIRQPLTAMAGAVKELARLVPLEEDEKRLVNIVSRESEPLNNIITHFLNYSREQTYDFTQADVPSLPAE